MLGIFFHGRNNFFLVGFSLTFPRFLHKSKNQLNTSLHQIRKPSDSKYQYLTALQIKWRKRKQPKIDKTHFNFLLIQLPRSTVYPLLCLVSCYLPLPNYFLAKSKKKRKKRKVFVKNNSQLVLEDERFEDWSVISYRVNWLRACLGVQDCNCRSVEGTVLIIEMLKLFFFKRQPI